MRRTMSESVIKRFFSYVEIMTKITSIFAFGMTLAYLFYLGQPVNLKLTGVFFLAMFIFDLTTTAINNYIDTKTNTQILQFNRKTALIIIYIMFIISAGLGSYLAYCTDIVVLLLGMLCFMCGVLYTYGPIPISRQPLGEIFSGVFYGLLIPFILLYINMPKGTYLDLMFTKESIDISVKWLPAIKVLFLSAAPVFTTANIMLANNICDVEKDVKVKRFTLPYYLGDKALLVFAFLYYAIYGAAIVMVVFRLLPPIYLVMIISIIPVTKNIRIFMEKQEKSTTFICSIKNYIIIMSADIIALLLCGLVG